MIKIKNILAILLVLSQVLHANAYEVKSKTSNSYILVRETASDAFEVLYCQQGADQCVTLGAKRTYSLQELNSLRNSQYMKAGLTGAGAAAAVLAGAWLGAIGGGFLGLKYLAGSILIDASMSTGMAAGVAITSTGIGLIDKLNPVKHYETAKMVSKMGTSSVDYVNDVDSQALWLHSRLKLIK